MASHKNLDGQKYIDSEFLSRQERTKLTVRLPKHKINKYKKYAFESKLALQDLIELALDKLLDGQTSLDGKQNLDGQLSRPKDDRSDHDLDIDIDDRSLDGQKLNEALNFYKEWTNNKLTHKDEISYYSIAHIDLLDIKIGILQAVKNSTTPVRMFSYCVKTILNNSKGRKPRYKYDKNQLLKDLIYEIEKREENKQT